MAAVLLVCGGIGMACYPWISNWMYGQAVQSEVKVYESQTEMSDDGELERKWAQVRRYNQKLSESVIALTDPFVVTEETSEESLQTQYDTALCMNEDGLMCFVEIPKIRVYLPVYHGTSEQVLKQGAGHLQNSALPTGTLGERPVISAHSGLSASKLFSDLEELEEGDLFSLHVLDQVFTYRVCDVQVIWPDETGQLLPQKDRDLVSLLTCTPYGVNTQRLVVTGEREKVGSAEVKDDEGYGNIEEIESEWMKNYRRALQFGIGIVTGAVLVHLILQRRRNMSDIRILSRERRCGQDDGKC